MLLTIGGDWVESANKYFSVDVWDLIDIIIVKERLNPLFMKLGLYVWWL